MGRRKDRRVVRYGRYHAPYSSKESNAISLPLPPGFTLEQAESPSRLSFGDAELVITRELVFGAKGIVNFPPDAYPQIKRAFDEMYGHDTHTLALPASGGGQ